MELTINGDETMDDGLEGLMIGRHGIITPGEEVQQVVLHEHTTPFLELTRHL